MFQLFFIKPSSGCDLEEVLIYIKYFFKSQPEKTETFRCYDFLIIF